MGKIHSDDFGYRPRTDKKILSLIKKRKLDSVSVLAEKADPKTLKMLAEFSREMPVYAHLDLLQGRNIFSFSLALIFGRISLRQVEYEIENQLRKLTQKGVKIVGIDSEQHTHAFSPISELVTEVAKRYQIKHIRSYKDIRTFTLLAKLKYLVLKAMAYATHLVAFNKLGLPSSWSISSPNRLVIMSWEGPELDFNELNGELKKTTVIIHPYMGFDTNTSYEEWLK